MQKERERERQILIASCLSYVNCASNKWHANLQAPKWHKRDETETEKQRARQGRCQMREMQMNSEDELLNNSTGCDANNEKRRERRELIGFD